MSAADGEPLEEVPLDSHGVVDESVSSWIRCDVRELTSGEYISELQFGYTSTDLVTLAYRVSGSLDKFSFGTSSSATL